MNLQNYLKHLNECAINNCKWCNKPEHEHSYRGNHCPDGNTYTSTTYELDANVPTCSCGLDALQSRLVLLPDGLKEKIVEVMNKEATEYSLEGYWKQLWHIESDDFNKVAEDIVKAVKGE